MSYESGISQRKIPVLPRHPGTFERLAATKETPELLPTQSSPNTSCPCADLHFYGVRPVFGPVPKSHTAFTISHREARLCLLKRQVLIPISEEPF
ncbi:hypothetical protein AVEN_142800-1 [Araneus ventricosus]|uniref:Uncharacterized protein n=1 Tax=Araneus ventricosus TaxID=182803 RepID=A0A4Y2L426_ARAVE|nr:hypothetical protein AVEN_142800-1 [Araneus ventricosus]